MGKPSSAPVTGVIDDQGTFLDYPNEVDEVHDAIGFRQFITTCEECENNPN